MSDLIDRQELISWLSKDPLFPQVESFGLTSVIESRPSVDAEPVVRCKDCKYATMTIHGECKYCDVWSPDEAIYLDGDEYCSMGERKEDAETN